jgi:hypothetical protein
MNASISRPCCLGLIIIHRAWGGEDMLISLHENRNLLAVKGSNITLTYTSS